MMEPETNDAPLSARAMQAATPPGYWRDVRDMIAGNAGPEFEKAFLELQKAIEPIIVADKENLFTKSRYASLGNVLSYVRPILHEKGFSLKQFCGALRGHDSGAKKWFSLPVATQVMHVESGQFDLVVADIPVDQSAHSNAAAQTYGRRYALLSYLGIATADDDAMATMLSRVDQEKAEEAVSGIVEKIGECKSEADLKKWLEANEDGLKLLTEASIALVRQAYGDRLKEMKKPPKAVEAA